MELIIGLNVKESLRCENCKYASQPEAFNTEHGNWIEVVCTAPVPVWAKPMHDDSTTGHKAATGCDCYKESD